MPAGGKPTGKESYSIALELEAIAEGKARPEANVSADQATRADVAAVKRGQTQRAARPQRKRKRSQPRHAR